MYDLFQYDLCIWIFDTFFSVDAGLTMLANPTHIRSRGAMHKNQTFEGEVWQHPCHSLLALPPWYEW
jgi:hypothetical protein